MGIRSQCFWTISFCEIIVCRGDFVENIKVSIIVVTYNSEDVIRTLESIYHQTYQNIELIIADDCSRNENIELIKEWMTKNRSRFNGVHLLRAKSNRGVTHNANRGLSVATGKYIKQLAGDDRLMSDSIEKYVKYAEKSSIGYFLAKQKFVGDEKIIRKDQIEKKFEGTYKALRNNDAYDLIINGGLLPTPTEFFSREFYKEFGGYDERFPFWEDGPFFYRMVMKQWPIGFIDEELVEVTIDQSSISHSEKESYVGYMHKKDQVFSFFLVRLRMLKKYKRWDLIQSEFWEHLSMIPELVKLTWTYRSRLLERTRRCRL